MKITIGKVSSTIVSTAIIVGVILTYAALASDVNKNSIHTLEYNIDRWTYLKLQYEATNPEPRPLVIAAQIIKWRQQINLALSEIKSRQEKR